MKEIPSVLTVRNIIKRVCGLVVGLVLWVYLSIFMIAILLRLSLRVPVDYSFFAGSIAESLGIGLSAFVMGLIISFFSANKEISTTIIGALIAVTIHLIQAGPYILIMPLLHRDYGLLEMVLSIISLLAFSILAAWLVARKRHLVV